MGVQERYHDRSGGAGVARIDFGTSERTEAFGLRLPEKLSEFPLKLGKTNGHRNQSAARSCVVASFMRVCRFARVFCGVAVRCEIR
ncbi:hypothetical protein V5799_012400 [Amblyomma americanum]|uniref:Uncharacterized protein n=1 Tax=Amblyomma americanum TaxID=6943 RepID=A0AAQ4EET8_AMBAM